MKFLAIKDFWKHQHYHAKRVPWVKLYAAVLTDAAFMQLPEAAQAQLMKLWALASQMGNPLPNNPKLLAGKIGVSGRFHVASLIDAGFLIPCASAVEVRPLSDETKARESLDEPVTLTRADARSRGETEEELEVETRTTQSVNAADAENEAADAENEAALAGLLATDADRVALTAIVARARSRSSCIAALRTIAVGDDPAFKRVDASAFGQSLRDYAANAAEWNAALFRGYLKRALAPPFASTNGRSTPAKRVPPQQYDYPAPSDPSKPIKW